MKLRDNKQIPSIKLAVLAFFAIIRFFAILAFTKLRDPARSSLSLPSNSPFSRSSPFSRRRLRSPPQTRSILLRPQDSLLSLLPAHLLQLSNVTKLTSKALRPLISWFHDNFHVKNCSNGEKSLHFALAIPLELRKGSPEKTPQKRGGWECGYYVMKNMLTIVSEDIVDTWEEVFSNNSPFTEEDISNMRQSFASFFLSYYEEQRMKIT